MEIFPAGDPVIVVVPEDPIYTFVFSLQFIDAGIKGVSQQIKKAVDRDLF